MLENALPLHAGANDLMTAWPSECALNRARYWSLVWHSGPPLVCRGPPWSAAVRSAGPRRTSGGPPHRPRGRPLSVRQLSSLSHVILASAAVCALAEGIVLAERRAAELAAERADHHRSGGPKQKFFWPKHRQAVGHVDHCSMQSARACRSSRLCSWPSYLCA